MRDQGLVARRYRRVWARWRRLRRRAGPSMGGLSWELVSLESEVRALAWALGVDPEMGNQPRYRGAEMMSPEDGSAPLKGARLTRAWTDRTAGNGKGRGRGRQRDYWLLEAPADAESGTEYWAAFLPEKYVAELALAFCRAIFGAHPADLQQLVERFDGADQPTVTDLRALLRQYPRDEANTGGDVA